MKREWNFVNLLRYAKMISHITFSFTMKLISLHRNFTGMLTLMPANFVNSYLEKYLTKRSFIVVF